MNSAHMWQIYEEVNTQEVIELFCNAQFDAQFFLNIGAFFLGKHIFASCVDKVFPILASIDFLLVQI